MARKSQEQAARDTASTEESGEQEVPAERSYAEYTTDERFGFDPHAELNLPADYKEVLRRFKRLQSGRGSGVLN